jgi:hypothetical protein
VTPLAYLKLILGSGLCCLLFFGGMSCGKASSVKLIAEKDRALEAAARSLTASADVLDLVNRRAAEAKVEAVAQALAAERAVKGAKQDAATYEARIGSIAAELEKAKRQPTCRAQLEQPLCVDLH